MIAVRCGTLFDGTGTDALDEVVLVVEDGVIMDRPAGDGVEVIDLSGYFVMPGLIDAHNHLSMIAALGDQYAQKRQPGGQQAMRVPFNLKKDLDAGTTTMRIMGEEDWLDVYARDAVRDGLAEGPDLLIATRAISSSHGYGRITTGYDGVDEIRRAVRENLDHGADFIKVFATRSNGNDLEQRPDYTYEEIRTAVEEAEHAGTYVAAHAIAGAGLATCIDAGVRTIEHASGATEDDVESMLERGCWVVGTYGILFHPDGIEAGEADDPSGLDRIEAAREQVAANAERILASGVRFALGTDSMHGHMAFEVETVVGFGVSPKRALVAATAGGAEALGIESRTGTLEPGKSADLIALDGNPLDDPTALERVVFVMKRGERVRG